MLDAPTTRSKRIAASVGAAGTNERNLGWSTEMHAGARTSANTRNAARPPIPPGVIVGPAAARRSSCERGPSSGGGSRRTRQSAYSTMASVSSAIESSRRCTVSVGQFEELAALVADLGVALERLAEDRRGDPAADQHEHRDDQEHD